MCDPTGPAGVGILIELSQRTDEGEVVWRVPAVLAVDPPKVDRPHLLAALAEQIDAAG